MTEKELADCGRPADDCPNEYNGPNRRGKQGWSLQKTIGVDALVAFIALLLTGVGYIAVHSRWEGHVDDTLLMHSDTDKKLEAAIAVNTNTIDKRFDRLEDKMDQIIRETRKK